MDYFHEQLVTHHRTAVDYLKIVAIIAAAVVLFVFLVAVVPLAMGSTMSLLSTVSLLLGVGALFGAYYLVRNTGIEYEYILTNNDLDVDKIIGKRKRCRLLSTKVSAFESFGVYRPEEHTNRGYSSTVLCCGVSAGAGQAYYAVFEHASFGKTLLIFNPDAQIVEGVKKFARPAVVKD